MLGGGYVHNVYGRAANYSDDGVSGLFGLRFGLGPSAVARVEAQLALSLAKAAQSEDQAHAAQSELQKVKGQ